MGRTFDKLFLKSEMSKVRPIIDMSKVSEKSGYDTGR